MKDFSKNFELLKLHHLKSQIPTALGFNIEKQRKVWKADENTFKWLNKILILIIWRVRCLHLLEAVCCRKNWDRHSTDTDNLVSPTDVSERRIKKSSTHPITIKIISQVSLYSYVRTIFVNSVLQNSSLLFSTSERFWNPKLRIRRLLKCSRAHKRNVFICSVRVARTKN